MDHIPHAVPLMLPDLPSQADWSIRILDADTGENLAEHEPQRVLKTASIGKIFLLAEIAHRIEIGELATEQAVPRSLGDPVEDSGLWYLLAADELPLADVCQLVGAFSDNLATNVLVRLIGVDQLAGVSAALGCSESALLDVVRDGRGPEHPQALSVGNASELAGFMARLHRGEIFSPTVSARVQRWLAAGADLSMVASAFALDPLAHNDFDRDVRLVNKTGTVTTARIDIGTVESGGRCIGYAVGANFDAGDRLRNQVLATMAEIGRRIGRSLGAPTL